ncbi:MAG: flavin reductase family protein [Pasteurellaceae bacterium]|nr:flavin reductase family protein [Pasteurellaceae bacterium]
MHQPINPQMFYYGFPVILLTTCDNQGNTNITPISSSWCLGDNIVIGLGTQGKAFENLQQCAQAVINLPDEQLWQNVEAIADVTAKQPIPDFQQGIYHYCADKFQRGHFTAQPSTQIKPSRILECPLQAETTVMHISEREGYAIVELKIVQVHAEQSLIFADNKIDPEKWKPLIYNFRHYQGLTEMLGKNFRCETGKKV